VLQVLGRIENPMCIVQCRHRWSMADAALTDGHRVDTPSARLSLCVTLTGARCTPQKQPERVLTITASCCSWRGCLSIAQRVLIALAGSRSCAGLEASKADM
jgi:hypothetical protein